MRLLNREKLVFLGTAAALCMAVAFALAHRPSFRDPGQHRVRIAVPARVEVRLPAEDAELDLSGRDPFSRDAEQRSGRADGVGKRAAVSVRKTRAVSLEVLQALEQHRRGQGGAEGHRASAEQPSKEIKVYEVPANFRGVRRPSGGRWRVVLEDKHSGELRSLFEGDAWPNLNLRIIRITSDAVLLEKQKGERVLMRDLYGRRVAGNRRDSARAEPSD
jgi:hypothetical protein